MNEFIDTYKHKGLRKALIEVLKEKGISDNLILEAIDKVPRHLFFNKEFEHFAYEDKAFPIENDQTISQPYTVAIQSQLLQIKKQDKILEIGTGSGYQCAVLCELSEQIYSIEIHEKLHKHASNLLKKLGYSPYLFCGNGYLGLPLQAPFDKIIVTAGAKDIPEALLAQLKIGGLMLIPVGDGDDLEMMKIIRMDKNRFERTKHGTFRFVPFVKE